MSSDFPRVTVVGTGNVGTQMAQIFHTTPVSSRTLENLPLDSDLYIIAVSDSAVSIVVKSLPKVNGIVVHTTGSVSIEVLDNMNFPGYGVLYPFQTISKQRPLPPESIPLLIEGNSPEVRERIRHIAHQAGFTKIDDADSEKRRRVHLCGVFACNFTNAMVRISQELLQKCGIDGTIINPLVVETVEKLKTLPASKAQTGPAVRHDIPTLEKHLSLLKELGLKDEGKIYSAVSDYILKK